MRVGADYQANIPDFEPGESAAAGRRADGGSLGHRPAVTQGALDGPAATASDPTEATSRLNSVYVKATRWFPLPCVMYRAADGWSFQLL